MMGFIGSILSIPYVVLFFVAWVVASLARPLWYISLACILANPTNSVRKIRLFGIAALYLAACNDKRWKLPKDDPATYFPTDEGGTARGGEAEGAGAGEDDDGDKGGTTTTTLKKTIVFVRHGESTWNETFNRGDRPKLSFLLGFVPGLVRAAAIELYLFVSGQSNESWFYDSPLSTKGVRQASDVRTFLRATRHVTEVEERIVRLMTASDATATDGDGNGGNGKDKDGEKDAPKRSPPAPPPSQLVSSNLRRAISTAAIGFRDRLDRRLPDDKVMILPQLQEISRNPDALCITPSRGAVLPSWIDRDVDGPYFDRVYREQVDTASFHDGNKPLDTNGLKRLEAFCRVVFDRIERDAVVAAGHSLWFRSFFRVYLPRGFDHVSKKKKLINGGCVSFTLMKRSTSAGDKFMIDPKSIHVIYGGF